MSSFLDRVDRFKRRYASMLTRPCGQIDTMITLVYQTFIAIINVLVLSGLSILQELSMNHESSKHHDIEQCTLYMDSTRPIDVSARSDRRWSQTFHNRALPRKPLICQSYPIKCNPTPAATCQNAEPLAISNSGTNKMATYSHAPSPTGQPSSSPTMSYISPIPLSYKKSLLLTAPYHPPLSPKYFDSEPNDLFSDHQRGKCRAPSPFPCFFQSVMQRVPPCKEESSIQPNISKVRLRLTKTIRAWDGTLEPNPFWHEIYNHGPEC